MCNCRSYSFIGTLLLASALAILGWGQTLTNLARMDFGKVEFSAETLNGNITMGPDGAITYSANSSGTGLGTAGQVRVDGTPGLVVTIGCTNTMTLTQVGGGALEIADLRLAVSTPEPFATATACGFNLSQNIATLVINTNPAQNIIYLGGRLVTNGVTVQNGIYRANNPGGLQATLRVVYQ